ncbi:TPA: hypothetical protein N3472_005156 [Klebsiella pneumoniae]|nr:hypothetical protein [Salmonella enterica subsp. enterica serovar Typhimurium]EGM8680974.1 hypothetical protein [Escherichia coli]HCM7782892.1 hypothetical protein [Klebsiella pneumoniae]
MAIISFHPGRELKMTKDEITETLKPLAEAIALGIASKQHVFNENLDLVITCKQRGVSNKLITECINENVPAEKAVEITYLKNILYRAGYKRSTKKTAPGKISKVADVNQQTSSENETEATTVPQDMKQRYLDACFKNERLAQRAIDGEVSVEMIESWKAPNSQRLSSILTNYLNSK